MGDDNCGTAGRQCGECALHSVLRFGIERACCLVEQQDRRVAQNGAGDRKSLTLPAREAYALLAEKGGEPGDGHRRLLVQRWATPTGCRVATERTIAKA